MQFISGANTITIREPQYEYSVSLVMALIFKRFGQSIGSWDNGSTYDYRVCEFELFTDDGEMKEVFDFFNDTDARTEPFTVRLAADSGFYIGGPDKGCEGDFTVSLYSKNESGMNINPFKFFSNDIKLVVSEFPAYSIPASSSEGTFEIGTVTGLRPPKITPFEEQATVRTKSLSGVVSSVNLGALADERTSMLECSGSVNKIASLISFLQSGSARDNGILVKAQENYFMFGSGLGSSGNYVTRLINNVITMQHVDYNIFNLNLDLWLQQ